MQDGPRTLAPTNQAARAEMQLRSSLSRPRPLRLHPSSQRKAISPLVFPFHLKASNPVFPAAPRAVLPAPTAVQAATHQGLAGRPRAKAAGKNGLTSTTTAAHPPAAPPHPVAAAPPEAGPPPPLGPRARP